MKKILVFSLLAAMGGLVQAKLPTLAPDPAAKAKADESAAKAAWQGKVDGWQLCKVQDKIAAAYAKSSAKAGAAPAKAGSAAAATPAGSAAAATAAGSAAGATAAASAVAAVPGASVAGATPAASGTPVAYKPPPPCVDPGPFAYNAPEQKPLETAGAHSPAGNATSPPAVKQESATMAPPKKP